MIKWNLKDTSFSHIKTGYSAPSIKSEYIEWDRECKSDGPTFYTHEQILVNEPTDNAYGILLESQAIIPHIYNALYEHPEIVAKYKTIFTHSSTLARKYKNTKWIPGGSIWIGGEYGGGKIGIHPKTKLCSMVSSDKKMCQLHNARIAIAELLKLTDAPVDFFGTFSGPWVPINESLQEYMFSIVMENYLDFGYFTEKLLNCFATGTIPIYCGSKWTENAYYCTVFNEDGIIHFEKPAELLDIFSDNKVSKEYFESKREAIEDNFNLCHQYRLVEDYIYRNYFRSC